ncbi:hypothetical protein SteCoe_13997 [Stentor coeruleus]|uniref:RING-type domain-containing protein n=1 Tax=Stentor coeruleus TaxID=5963 RepID=A0A1R2C764_9CILI|nr:hypothetical protein SteCoe_13997 [Stentor coeruleus]
MECSVCLEKYNSSTKQPIVLECGHTLCKECVKDIINKMKECPMDREPITKPFNQLKVNYSLLDLLISMNALNLKEEEKQLIPPKINQIQVLKIEAKNKLPQYLYCAKMHQIQYWEETSIYYFTEFGTHSIYCDYCKFTWQGGSWHCGKCSFDICETCKSDQLKKECLENDCDMRCFNDHKLYYYTNTVEFYFRKCERIGFMKCQKCYCDIVSSSYSCRICDFDLCSQCKITGIMPKKIKCPNNHFLTYKSLAINNILKCSNCNIEYTESTHSCVSCIYDLCLSCFNSENLIQKLPEKCPSGHNLYYSDHQIQIYKVLYNTEEFICNSCEKAFSSDENYHCSICEYDLCNTCYNIMRIGMENGINKVCKRNHVLRYYHGSSIYYGNKVCCGICNKERSKSGSFHCRICKYDICIPCAEEFIIY